MSVAPPSFNFNLGINENNLKNLLEQKPLIISLDDLEIFWGSSSPESTVEAFSQHVSGWASAQKGIHHFLFSRFASLQHNDSTRNPDYRSFFIDYDIKPSDQK